MPWSTYLSSFALISILHYTGLLYKKHLLTKIYCWGATNLFFLPFLFYPFNCNPFLIFIVGVIASFSIYDIFKEGFANFNVKKVVENGGITTIYFKTNLYGYYEYTFTSIQDLLDKEIEWGLPIGSISYKAAL